MFGDMDIRGIGVEKASGQAGGTGCFRLRSLLLLAQRFDDEQDNRTIRPLGHLE